MSEKMPMSQESQAERSATIVDSPVKLTGEATMDRGALEQQAEHLKDSVVEVDYAEVRGTCIDERQRVGANTEPRPSVPGGPNIYGLYIAELTGQFSHSDLTPTERLKEVTQRLNRNGVKSGGHKRCAAAGGFGDACMPNLAANPDGVRDYAQSNMTDYDEELMSEVLDHAQRVEEAKTYQGWDGEAALIELLGDEADEAIEELADEPHGARTFARTNLENTTISQNAVHEASDGEDSYNQDDAYADRIENALAAGPDAAREKRLMEHAREAVLAAVVLSVPNRELHQINVS